MMRIALCDDESKILDEVSQYINKYADKKNIQSLEVFPFDSARSLKNKLRVHLTFFGFPCINK